MGLAGDRPTLYRTKDPAHSVTPRQQRYLSVCGASSMLEHPAFLSGAFGPGALYRLRYGGPRVRIRLPPAESLRIRRRSGRAPWGGVAAVGKWPAAAAATS